MKKIITIDGLASSGKSALSKNLAQKRGWGRFRARRSRLGIDETAL